MKTLVTFTVVKTARICISTHIPTHRKIRIKILQFCHAKLPLLSADDSFPSSGGIPKRGNGEEESGTSDHPEETKEVGVSEKIRCRSRGDNDRVGVR